MGTESNVDALIYNVVLDSSEQHKRTWCARLTGDAKSGEDPILVDKIEASRVIDSIPVVLKWVADATADDFG